MRLALIDKKEALKYQPLLQEIRETQTETVPQPDEEAQDGIRIAESAEASSSSISSAPITSLAASMISISQDQGEALNETSSLLDREGGPRGNYGTDLSSTEALKDCESSNAPTKSLWVIVSDSRFVTASCCAILRAAIGGSWSATIPLHAKQM